jgi:hypothetical protein
VPAREAHLSLGGTLAEAFSLYRRHWRLLAPLAVAVLLPQAVLGSVIGDLEVDRIESFGDVVNLLSIPLITAVALGGEALLAGLITGLVREWRVGHRLPGAATFVRNLPWVSLITVDLLLAAGTAAGLLLLVLPGLVFITYFAISPAVIELEGRGVVDALRRSASLVRRNFPQAFALIVGAALITEGLAEGLTQLFHHIGLEVVSEIVVGALLESVQGLIVALMAISLIHLHGDEIPAPKHH